MKKLIVLSIALFALFACKSEKNEKETNSQTTDSVVVVSVKEFNENAANYAGKKIGITGVVDHVCKHGGKKILLVQDGVDEGVHVTSDERFDENLTGSQVTVVGIVKTKVIDEAYCQQLEEEQKSDDHEKQNVEEIVKFYRDSMQKAGVDSLVFYSIEFVEFKNSDNGGE